MELLLRRAADVLPAPVPLWDRRTGGPMRRLGRLLYGFAERLPRQHDVPPEYFFYPLP
jgi:hypothetical protein